MKWKLKKLLMFVIFLSIIINSYNVFSQPEPPLGNAGQEGPMNGGGAPVNGAWILLVLSTLYYLSKKYFNKKS